MIFRKVNCWIMTIFVMMSCQVLNAGFGGSEHDFSSSSWLKEKSSCNVCHSLEGVRGSEKFRWTHETSSAHYFTYSSATLKSAIAQPSNLSLFCLSCHDGTVALDAYGGRKGSVKIRKNMGTDLSKVHPVSFVYNDSLAAMSGHLKRPSRTSSGLGATIEEDLLVDGKMECTSCHESHNRYNEGHLLIRRDGGGSSGLCGICHTSVPPGEIDMGQWE